MKTVILLFFSLILTLASPGQSFTSFKKTDGLGADGINAISLDLLGNKWFGTANGLVKYDGRRFENYSSANGLVGNNAHAIVIENNSTAWIGTFTGLSRFHHPPDPKMQRPDTGEDFAIYPNPTNNKIHLRIEDRLINSKLSELTMEGNQVMTNRLRSAVNEIDLSGLPPGTYLLVLSTPKGIINKKVIKL